jgi:hypothetical protein
MTVGLMDQNLINACVNDDVENVIAAEQFNAAENFNVNVGENTDVVNNKAINNDCFLLNLFLLVCEH